MKYQKKSNSLGENFETPLILFDIVEPPYEASKKIFQSMPCGYSKPVFQGAYRDAKD